MLNKNLEIKFYVAGQLLPLLFQKMQGTGEINIDTDSMSVANPGDRRFLGWLAKLTAEFVLQHRNVWKPQVDESMERISAQTERLRILDELFQGLRTAVIKEDISVAELKELLAQCPPAEKFTFKPVEQSSDFQKEVFYREAENIFPKLYRKMGGNGGLRLDTDSMSLTDAHDRHYLEWLSRLIAGFVVEEQEAWEFQLQECVKTISENADRLHLHEYLLEQLNEAVDTEDSTVEALKPIVERYRTPLEAYYDEMEKRRKLSQMFGEKESEQATGE